MLLQINNHKHDRFLFEKEGHLCFGCINPFCGHGDPKLPRFVRIPLDHRGYRLSLVSHKDRKITFTVTPTKDVNGFKAGEPVTVIADDNLESCDMKFGAIFGEKEEAAE